MGQAVLIQSPEIKNAHEFIPKLFDEGFFRAFSRVIFDSKQMPEIYQENLLGILIGI